MRRFLIAFCGLILISLALLAASPPQSTQLMVDATVTGTPEGPMIVVPDQVNVRLGPGTNYAKVGVLIAGQEAPALGRSPGGEWIQIAYPGVPGNVAWVYAPFVVLDAGQELLPIIEPPPTPTPRIAPTIDPTLAAQFNLGEAPATRLPTFTPADPVIYPTLESLESEVGQGFPPILAILGLLVVGLFGTVVSFLRGS
ncbi:MAG: SH3 domain-containing protein [Anaerolineaceae bacterium]|nr:MAG: SH3 domain-containing protein [Anaerolineaceae bacterium]